MIQNLKNKWHNQHKQQTDKPFHHPSTTSPRHKVSQGWVKGESGGDQHHSVACSHVVGLVLGTAITCRTNGEIFSQKILVAWHQSNNNLTTCWLFFGKCRKGEYMTSVCLSVLLLCNSYWIQWLLSFDRRTSHEISGFQSFSSKPWSPKVSHPKSRPHIVVFNQPF